MLNKLKKSTLEQLETFVLLVYYSFKAAYLVDCCMLSREEAVTFTQGILRQHKLDMRALCVILVESDVFIRRKSVVLSSLDGVSLPIVLKVSRTGVSLGGVDEVGCIIQSIYTALDNISEENSSLFTDIASPPLIAGLLLGYPCIYQAEQSGTDDHSSSALSMVELHKVCILADVTINIVAKSKRRIACSYQGLEILGFSIPQSILNEGPEVEQQLNTHIDAIMHRLLALQAAQKESCPLAVRNIRLERTVTVVPSIVL